MLLKLLLTTLKALGLKFVMPPVVLTNLHVYSEALLKLSAGPAAAPVNDVTSTVNLLAGVAPMFSGPLIASRSQPGLPPSNPVASFTSQM